LSKYLTLVLVVTPILLAGLLLIPYISNTQALPVRDGKEMNFFNASNAIYEGNGEKLVSNKNISLIPNLITEQKYIENGLLNGVENVTNIQTYLNTMYQMICSWEKEMELLKLWMDKMSPGFLQTLGDKLIINGYLTV
jgi:hypothetical protein